MTSKKSPKNIAAAAAVFIVLTAVDQLTKYLAVLQLKDKPPFVLIPEVFEFRYLENQSAAFGVDLLSILQQIFHFSYFNSHPDAFLTCKMIFFVVLTLIVVVFFGLLYLRIPQTRRYRAVHAILIVFSAGAVGNCIDRIRNRYVVDFFYFKLIDFPIFNVADIYVTVSVFFLIILCLFYYKEEDYEIVFPSRKETGEKHKDHDENRTI